MTKAMDLKAIGKILVATFQILGNLSVVLSITFPQIFGDFMMSFIGKRTAITLSLHLLVFSLPFSAYLTRWPVHMTAFFKFDLVGVFRLGCVSNGSYMSGLMINLVVVVIVVVVVLIDYLCELTARQPFSTVCTQC